MSHTNISVPMENYTRLKITGTIRGVGEKEKWTRESQAGCSHSLEVSKTLTWFELDLHSSITLDLFDHFPIPANYNSHRVTGNRNL